ncbi:MAG: uroporphyrinogen-III synthase [Planctomycetes bacterium]|nr:uroporphyrinogen-III synthase [Planctomycetota bacterium]
MTRPGAAGARDVAELRARGGEAQHHPAIRIETLPPVPDHLASLASCDRLLLTSSRALEGLLGTGRAPRAALTWAVGAATAAAAAARGLAVTRTGRGDGLASLIEDILATEEVAGLEVLWPHGDLSDPDVARPLVEAGARLEGRVVYRTRDAYRDSPPPAEFLSRVTGVLFTSPSAVENLFGVLDAEQRRRFVREVRYEAIGPTTLAACRRWFAEI